MAYAKIKNKYLRLEWEAENRLEVLQQHQGKKQEWQMLNEQNQQLLKGTLIKQGLL